MNKFDALMSTKASDCFPVTSMSTYIIPLGLVLLILNEAEDPQRTQPHLLLLFVLFE